MTKTILALVLMLGACAGGGDGNGKDAADDTAGGGGDDTGGGTSNADVSPRVASVDSVDCTEQQSAGETWQMEITVTDPQGDDTIAGGLVNVVNEEGGVMADYDLACGDGSCFGGFRADYDGITCSLEGTISMVFQVWDEDGNYSAEKSYETH
jgi:hypothetical protein